MTYRTEADNLVTISGAQTLGEAGHAARHNEGNSAIKALADAADARVAVVAHGATAGTARPAGVTRVLWEGTVVPSNAVAGDLLSRTDLDKLYLRDATEFLPLATEAYVDSAASASIRVPDGASQAEVQSIINDAAAVGRPVEFGPGTWDLTGVLTLPDNAHVLGVPGQTVLRVVNGADLTEPNGIVRNEDVALGNSNITVVGLTIDANRANNSHDASVLRFSNCWHVRCVDVTVKGASTPTAVGGAGLLFSNGRYLWAVRCVATDCQESGLATTAGPQHVYFTDCLAYDNDKEGFHTSTGTSITLTGCQARNNGIFGFQLTNATRLTAQGCIARLNGYDGFTSLSGQQTLIGCWADANGRRGFSWTITGSSSFDTLFTGCQSTGNAEEGMWFGNHGSFPDSGVERVLVSDCLVRGNGSGFDAIRFSKAGGDKAIYRVEGGSYEAVGAGRSINFAAADFDQRHVDAYCPQGVWVDEVRQFEEVVTPAPMLIRDTGAAGVPTFGQVGITPVWIMPNGAISRVAGSVRVPAPWKEARVYARVINLSGAAGNVRLRFNRSNYALGGDASTVIFGTHQTRGPFADGQLADLEHVPVSVEVTGGGYLALSFERAATSEEDTVEGDLAVVELIARRWL